MFQKYVKVTRGNVLLMYNVRCGLLCLGLRIRIFNTIYVLKRTLSCQIRLRILHDESVRAD